ncbi:MAG: tocopherol cyclase family protein [Oscillospiraceae bacterium]
MNSYFEGCYFKVQNDTQALALIPAFHIDGCGNKSSSLQLITPNFTGCKWFPRHSFHSLRKPLSINLDGNIFSRHGILIDVDAPDFSVKGRLKFENLTPLTYNIMGPFCCVPFMECRHSIFSMTHTVTGRLVVNGEIHKFDSAVGYIEGDRGSSFPRNYGWTQCNFFDESPASIVLSMADIPFGITHFTGIIAVVFWRGKQYRLATYLGAQPMAIQNGTLCVKQGDYTLTATLLTTHSTPLYAPVSGNMTRLIKENIACTVYYRFSKGGMVLFDFVSHQAAFEYEYPQ